MKDYITIISSVGVAVGGILAFAWALVSGFRKRSTEARQLTERAQASLLEVVQAEAKAWRQRYESEHEEFVSYRQKTHDNAQTAQATVLKLTAENGELKAKTDLTPILKFHQDQSDINAKVVQTLDAILKKLGNGNEH